MNKLQSWKYKLHTYHFLEIETIIETIWTLDLWCKEEEIKKQQQHYDVIKNG